MRRPWLWLVLASGCSGFDPSLSKEPFLCGSSDPKCPSGYTCQPGGGSAAPVCLANGAMLGMDAPAVNCHDDSALEPNDSIESAFQTPLEQRATTVSYAGLSICPPTDKDTYQIDIKTAGDVIDAVMVYEPGEPLVISLFGSDGTKLVDGAPTAAADTLEVKAASTATGAYYLQVSSPNNTENNYTIDLTTSMP